MFSTTNFSFWIFDSLRYEWWLLLTWVQKIYAKLHFSLNVPYKKRNQRCKFWNVILSYNTTNLLTMETYLQQQQWKFYMFLKHAFRSHIGSAVRRVCLRAYMHQNLCCPLMELLGVKVQFSGREKNPQQMIGYYTQENHRFILRPETCVE